MKVVQVPCQDCGRPTMRPDITPVAMPTRCTLCCPCWSLDDVRAILGRLRLPSRFYGMDEAGARVESTRARAVDGLPRSLEVRGLAARWFVPTSLWVE